MTPSIPSLDARHQPHTTNDPALSAITVLAAQLLDNPMAWVSLIDRGAPRILVHHGFGPSDEAIATALCAIVSGTQSVVLADPAQDTRFRATPLAPQDAPVRFFAAVPLLSPEGDYLGVLGVMGNQPRKPSQNQLRSLEQLGVLGSALIGTPTQHRSRLTIPESETLSRTIAANLPGMVYQYLLHTDGSRRYLYVNEGCQALLGISPQGLIDAPNTFLNLVLEEDRPSYIMSMNTSADTLSIWNWVGRIFVKDWNDIKWINLRSIPSRVPEGILWEGIMTNITQSKVAEEEIKRSRQQLSELSSHIESVIEQERARIAREIHDDLGGNLTAIKIDLAWLTKRLPPEMTQLADKVREVDDLVDRTIDATSRISHDLRPGILDAGLVPAIRWQAKEFEKLMGITCELDCPDDDLAVDPDTSSTVFRIFQETLTNIAKHAQASKVRITVWRDRHQLWLEVVDNGKGIAAADRLKPHSFGIRGILERVAQLNGEAHIDSAPDAGTTVAVQVPLSRKAQKTLPL